MNAYANRIGLSAANNDSNESRKRFSSQQRVQTESREVGNAKVNLT